MTEIANRWLDIGRLAGVYWKNDNDPIRLHRLVTSGQKPDDFLDGSVIRRQPLLLEDACKDVLVGFGYSTDDFDWVIGSHESVMMSHHVARWYGARTGYTEMVLNPVRVTLPFVAKTCAQYVRAKFQGTAGNLGIEQTMVLRHGVGEGDNVLVVDMVFNKERIRKVIALVEGKGAEVFDKVVVILNQSGMTHLDGREIISLIDEEPVHYESHGLSRRGFF